MTLVTHFSCFFSLSNFYVLYSWSGEAAPSMAPACGVRVMSGTGVGRVVNGLGGTALLLWRKQFPIWQRAVFALGQSSAALCQALFTLAPATVVAKCT